MSKENNGSSMDALLEEYAPILKNLIRYSSAANAKDISFYKSIDSSIRDTANDINSELIDSMNDILMSAITVSNDNTENIRFKEDFEQENNQILSNILDTLLERVEINIDNHYKAKRNKKYAKSIVSNSVQSNDEYTYLDKSDASHTKTNNTNYNNIPKSNSNMEKPQSKFLNKIDNFETSPFKPLISIKPNAMQSLNESLQLIESTDEVPEHYENPYFYEIMNSEYPEWILSEVPDNEKYQSIPWDGSPEAQWIDSPEKLDSLLIELNKCKVIAIDLEHHDYRTYHGLTSLMQITTDTKQDYLIDPLSPTLRPHLTILNEVFTNPAIIKVLHGAFMDVIWLQRDLGLYLVSLFDTFHAAKQLALGKYSLAYLLEEYVRFRTSKKWQLADWRTRPLSSEMMDYAKADTHFLIEIFYKMHEDLLKIPNALQKALYASRKVACRRFEYSTYRPKNLSMNSNNDVVTTNASVPLIDEITNKITLNYDRDLPWTNLIFSNNIPLEKRPLLEILFKWRDNEARKEDESPRFIMSDFLLVSLVNTFEIGQEDNVNVNSVMAVINKTSKFSGSYYARKVINDLTEVIKNALVELKGIDLNKLLTTIDKTSKNDEFIATTNNTGTNNIDLYETVKDVNKLKENFGNFMNFYNRNISGSKDSNLSTIQSSNESDIFAIEYNKEGKINIIKNKSIDERINEVVTFFNKDMDKNVEFEIDAEDIVESEEEEEEGREVETAETDNEPIAGSQNEIITLRKKNRNGQVKKRKADDLSTSEDLSVNFSKTIMEKEDEGTNRRDRFKKQKQQKKPSFDPYSTDLLSDMNIPQLKKKKMVDRGKNIVFKQKK